MRFNLYRIEPDYCGYLQQFDNRVPYAASPDKITRPFIGVGIEIDGFNYMAPLSSPKPKHIKMKETVDFIKIKGGKLGVINLNNMIPVPKGIAKMINLNAPIINREYSELLKNQLFWCNQSQNRQIILKKARNLYHYHKKGTLYPNHEKRCCNFTLLEEKAQEYINAPTQNNAQQSVLPNQVPSMTNNIGGIHFGN